MNKIAAEIVTKKAADTAAEIRRIADEEITISKKVLTLEIAVAFLGGIVLGMFLSPRKKVSYKIASDNRINQSEDEPEEDYEEDPDDDDDSFPHHNNTLKF